MKGHFASVAMSTLLTALSGQLRIDVAMRSLRTRASFRELRVNVSSPCCGMFESLTGSTIATLRAFAPEVGLLKLRVGSESVSTPTGPRAVFARSRSAAKYAKLSHCGNEVIVRIPRARQFE